MKWALLLCFFLSFSSLATLTKLSSSLILVQEVSSSKRSIVIRKGAADGVYQDLKAYFKGEAGGTILLKATEINRNFSLWEPVNTGATIPFKKKDLIHYSLFSPDTQKPIILNVYEKKFSAKAKDHKFHFLSALNFGFSESVSGETQSYEAQSSNVSFSLHWKGYAKENHSLWLGMLYSKGERDSSTIGARLARSSLGSSLDYMYRFEKLPLYFKTGLSLLYTTTKFQSQIDSALEFVIPKAALGTQIKLTREQSLLLEAGLSLTSGATLNFEGEEATGSRVLAYGALGISF